MLSDHYTVTLPFRRADAHGGEEEAAGRERAYSLTFFFSFTAKFLFLPRIKQKSVQVE